MARSHESLTRHILTNSMTANTMKAHSGASVDTLVPGLKRASPRGSGLSKTAPRLISSNRKLGLFTSGHGTGFFLFVSLSADLSSSSSSSYSSLFLFFCHPCFLGCYWCVFVWCYLVTVRFLCCCRDSWLAALHYTCATLPLV